MIKQTVYRTISPEKADLDCNFWAVCLLNSPLLERSDDLSNYTTILLYYAYYHSIIKLPTKFTS